MHVVCSGSERSVLLSWCTSDVFQFLFDNGCAHHSIVNASRPCRLQHPQTQFKQKEVASRIRMDLFGTHPSLIQLCLSDRCTNDSNVSVFQRCEVVLTKSNCTIGGRWEIDQSNWHYTSMAVSSCSKSFQFHCASVAVHFVRNRSETTKVPCDSWTLKVHTPRSC